MKNKRIGSLWLKTAKTGKSYYSGTIDLGVLGEIRVVAFDNDKGDNDKLPDIVLLLSEKKEKRTPPNNTQFEFKDTMKETVSNIPVTEEITIINEKINLEDIPF